MEEPAPYMDTTGAAGGGNCRFVESPSQDQRLQAQRLRNPEIRGPVQTPQNRPHGHQSPDLPEGYGKSFPESLYLAKSIRGLYVYIFVFDIKYNLHLLICTMPACM